MKVIYLYEKKIEAKLLATLANLVRGWLQKPTLVTTSTIAEHNRALCEFLFVLFLVLGSYRGKKNE